MPTMDEQIDRFVEALIQGTMFLARAIVCAVPLFTLAPLLDVFTCWHFALTARTKKFIITGSASGSVPELRETGYMDMDGTTMFNMIDIFCQMVYVPVVSVVALVCVLIDVFTCNQAKATSTTVPLLLQPIISMRGFFRMVSYNPDLEFISDLFWQECCGGFGQGLVQGDQAARRASAMAIVHPPGGGAGGPAGSFRGANGDDGHYGQAEAQHQQRQPHYDPHTAPVGAPVAQAMPMGYDSGSDDEDGQPPPPPPKPVR